jgi:hypothetical protein
MATVNKPSLVDAVAEVAQLKGGWTLLVGGLEGVE